MQPLSGKLPCYLSVTGLGYHEYDSSLSPDCSPMQKTLRWRSMPPLQKTMRCHIIRRETARTGKALPAAHRAMCLQGKGPHLAQPKRHRFILTVLAQHQHPAELPMQLQQMVAPVMRQCQQQLLLQRTELRMYPPLRLQGAAAIVQRRDQQRLLVL